MRKKIINNRVEQIQVSAIKQMPLLAQAIENSISLGQGIPDVPTPEYIRKAVIKELESDTRIGQYSLQPGMPELKQEIAKRLEKETLRTVDADKEVFITVGAMEALAVGLTTIIQPGDEVIIFNPGYTSYTEQVILAGGKPVYVPLIENKEWSLDQAALQKAVNKKTKSIIVCNPANPTGSVLSKLDLDLIVELAVENDLVIVADETYKFLVYDDTPFKSLLEYPEIQDRLVIAMVFLKNLP